MYTLTKLSKPSLAFINSVTNVGANRSEAYQIALAYVLARPLALPAEPVEDPVHYFRLQHEIAIVHALDDYNELAPVNVNVVKDLVLNLFQHRYAAANPAIIPLALREGSGLVDFFGLSKFFSEATLCVIEKDSEKLTRFISGLTTVAQDLVEARLKGRAAWDAIPVEQDRYVAS